ncbi:hypothetical protein J2W97_001372 [Paenibacillus jamilae]|uniref:Uncharacterized protein n=1 Tax=Paenibacillus peoriae TaxID=59893 RepID=A0A7H0Y2P6_9BACL|nr:hypothetical protein [Paenibacillus peoriae]MDP9675389.1 hypothetical protein [Paenibacillus jamilae]QNR65354.1 hypothetical protein IAQ67_15775 [Paenibacillus peoriae]
MDFTMDNFINETKQRDNYIKELKNCVHKDGDGFPNIYVDRVWGIIDGLDSKMKDRLLFWFITEHLTIIND